MRRTAPFGQRTPLILVVVVVLTLTVGVVVYQTSQRADGIPGSAGGFDTPRDQGGPVTDDPIAAWAGDAAAGDYAAAQQRMDDNTLLFGMWKAAHETMQPTIVGYEIHDQQTVGQTTTATVQFMLADKEAWCIPVLLDESTQRIYIDSSYNRCAAQP